MRPTSLLHSKYCTHMYCRHIYLFMIAILGLMCPSVGSGVLKPGLRGTHLLVLESKLITAYWYSCYVGTQQKHCGFWSII